MIGPWTTQLANLTLKFDTLPILLVNDSSQNHLVDLMAQVWTINNKEDYGEHLTVAEECEEVVRSYLFQSSADSSFDTEHMVKASVFLSIRVHLMRFGDVSQQ